MLRPGALARTLGALPVQVDRVGCRFAFVPLPGYGDPGRPATFVELAGGGHTGAGELVSFSELEHARFAARAPGLLAGRQGRVEDLLAGAGAAAPHERTALEGALLDLALRQGGLALADLCRVGEGRLRWVASFGPQEDPLGALPAGRPELKLDVHPGWTEGVLSGLAAQVGGRLIILDWKEQGAPALARRCSAAFPQVIFEDPPDGCRHPHIARDRPLARAADVRAALGRGERVNLKAPRMGGFLELLRGLDGALPAGEAAAAVDTVVVYFGGMYEVGPGREQARQLAAIYCPDAPNDLAPFAGGASSLLGPSPSRLALDRPGFGSNLDWSAGPG